MDQGKFSNITVVIPARYASSRFPGKPLADLAGKPMILHVWDKCIAAGMGNVLVATDDARIAAVCQDAGAKVVMTDPDLPSGTDRCAAAITGVPCQWVINVQGDEPLMDPSAIRALAEILVDQPDIAIATLARTESDPTILSSPNVVKVVRNLKGDALYFSRSPIPFFRDSAHHIPTSLVHLGIYGFRRDTLLAISRLTATKLETTEQLEQLRWLDHGYPIRVGITAYRPLGVDVPEDLERANNILAGQKD